MPRAAYCLGAFSAATAHSMAWRMKRCQGRSRRLAARFRHRTGFSAGAGSPTCLAEPLEAHRHHLRDVVSVRSGSATTRSDSLSVLKIVQAFLIARHFALLHAWAANGPQPGSSQCEDGVDVPART